MRFTVRRTSLYCNEEETPPCPGAVYLPCFQVSRYGISSPDQFTYGHQCESWLTEGVNHRVIDGKIARDMPEHAWFIDLPDLDAVIAFIAEHGRIIIAAEGYKETAASDHECPSIEIYDEYRE
jgi:hypothetical protein